MTKTQSTIVALIGAAYLAFAFHIEGTSSIIIGFFAGLHICAAFTIKE